MKRAQEQRDIPFKQPLVTIALPVYNGAATLAVAVQSIFMQSFTDWELILLNDASTDDSLAVMRSFSDPRVRLVEGDSNIGLSSRLNMAVDMARGQYFARMDQDDISFPERIEKQVNYLQGHPEIDLLGTATIPFRGDGEALGCLPVAISHEEICARPWNGFHMPHPTWMGKNDWFKCHRYMSFADGAEDQHLLLRTYRVSRFACLDEPLLAYREGERPFRKLLRARYIMARSYIRYFLKQHRYCMIMRVILLFVAKVVADVMNKLGVTSARNRLLLLTDVEQIRWQQLWKYDLYL